MERGLRKRIGNGFDTNIWTDSWLPSDPHGKILTTKAVNSSCPVVVADLIEHSTHSWKWDVIEEHFWLVDRNRIAEVPFGSCSQPNRWIWNFSSNGLFSVKTCYHMILSNGFDSSSSTGVANYSGSHLSQQVWKHLWKLKLPPKILVFLWRALKDALPTGLNLFRTGILNSPFCFRCHSAVESVGHALFGCGHLSIIWCNSPFSLIPIVDNCTFLQWFYLAFSVLDGPSFLLAMVICWRLWDIRNPLLHGNLEVHDVDVIR